MSDGKQVSKEGTDQCDANAHIGEYLLTVGPCGAMLITRTYVEAEPGGSRGTVVIVRTRVAFGATLVGGGARVQVFERSIYLRPKRSLLATFDTNHPPGRPGGRTDKNLCRPMFRCPGLPGFP